MNKKEERSEIEKTRSAETNFNRGKTNGKAGRYDQDCLGKIADNANEGRKKK